MKTKSDKDKVHAVKHCTTTIEEVVDPKTGEIMTTITNTIRQLPWDDAISKMKLSGKLSGKKKEEQ